MRVAWKPPIRMPAGARWRTDGSEMKFGWTFCGRKIAVIDQSAIRRAYMETDLTDFRVPIEARPIRDLLTRLMTAVQKNGFEYLPSHMPYDRGPPYVPTYELTGENAATCAFCRGSYEVAVGEFGIRSWVAHKIPGEGEEVLDIVGVTLAGRHWPTAEWFKDRCFSPSGHAAALKSKKPHAKKKKAEPTYGECNGCGEWGDYGYVYTTGDTTAPNGRAVPIPYCMTCAADLRS